MRCWVVFFPSLQEYEELLGSIFLKQPHQGATDSLPFSARDFTDLIIRVHERTRDLLELEVSQDIGVNQDFDEFTRGNDKLRDKINSIVAVPAQLRGWRLVRAEFPVELRLHRCISGSSFSCCCNKVPPPASDSNSPTLHHSNHFCPCGGLSSPLRITGQKGYTP